MGRKKTSYFFTLTGITVEDALYSHNEGTPVQIEDDPASLASLLHDGDRRVEKFFAVYREPVKYWANMFDYNNYGALPNYTTKPCWWCRCPFDTSPFGCPIGYHKTPPEDSEKRKRIEAYFEKMNYSADDGNYDIFETEGLFCSLPCVKAYILQENALHPGSRYSKSLTYLSLLTLKLYGKVLEVQTAPTWKILEDYGGHMTPYEYRATFEKLEYNETSNVKRPLMFSSSTYIQEKKL